MFTSKSSPRKFAFRCCIQSWRKGYWPIVLASAIVCAASSAFGAISPNDFQGTDSARINQAIADDQGSPNKLPRRARQAGPAGAAMGAPACLDSPTPPG